MRSVLGILPASLLVAVGLAAPTYATQVAAKKFISCDSLVAEYASGVAKSKAAANRAAMEGFARPKVSSALYKANGSRLDRDNDGVMCERQVTVPNPSGQATETAAPASSVIYFPTGLPIIDVIYQDKAKKGEISQDQANFMISYVRTIARQNVSSLCGPWISQTFQNSFLDSFTRPDVAASSNLTGQEAWIRETAGLLTSSWCVSKGYNYSVMLP